jgi:hypothetical protein
MSANPVPIFDPEGTLRDVPYEQMTDAVKAGGVPAVQMKGPDGQIRHVPANQIKEAAAAGGQMIPFEQQEVQHPGFWASLGGDLKDMAKGGLEIAGAMGKGPQGLSDVLGPHIASTIQNAPSEYRARKEKGYSLPYRAAAPVAEAVGVNVPGMEQSAQEGDVAGVAGHAAAVPAAMAMTAGAAKALPAVAEGVGVAKSYFTGEAIQTDLKGSVKGLAQKVVLENTGQPPPNTPEATAWHQEALAQAKAKLPNASMSEQLQEAGKIQKVGPPAKELSPSIRKNFEEAGDTVYAKSKAIYSQIDAATDGKFQSTTTAMKNIDKKLADVHGVNPDQEGALLEQRGQLETAQNQMWEEAKQKGVASKLVDQAKANYRKAQALYDLDRHIKMSTSGVEPVTTETLDPKKLSTRLERLYDSGRLQEAVGNDGAHSLLKESHSAEVRQTRLSKVKKVAGRVAGGAAAIAGGRELVKGFEH